MHIDDFIVSALLVLLATSIAVSLFKHLGLGSVLGLLVAGIAVGPHSPGPYVTTHVDDVRHFAELGVVLLLFVIGLEMQPSRLWAMRRQVFGLGSLQILLSGAAIGLWFFWDGYAWGIALLIGLTFALSSTAFVLQLLQEKGELGTPYGEAAFSILLMQDIAIVPLLAAVPILSDTGRLSAEVPFWQQVAIVAMSFAAVLGFGRLVVPRVFHVLARQGNREGFLLVVLLTVFAAAWAMHQAGVSMALGAFLMGMMLSGSRYRLQVQAVVEPYKGVMMSLFFVAVGMSIDFHALGADLLRFGSHTLAIVVLKLVVLVFLLQLFGFGRRMAARLSFLLAQGGEFGFVLFGSAKALEVIDDATFVLAVGVISLTMLLTPVLVQVGDAIGRRLGRGDADGATPFRALDAVTNPQVVIGGYGRVGHSIAVLLDHYKIPFAAFDKVPARVNDGRRQGFHVYYGDIGDPQLQQTAHLENASIVVLTVDHTASALRAVTHMRTAYPNLTIIARGHDLADCARLIEAGATQALPETLEVSLALARLTLSGMAVPRQEIDALLDTARVRNYELMDVRRG